MICNIWLESNSHLPRWFETQLDFNLSWELLGRIYTFQSTQLLHLCLLSFCCIIILFLSTLHTRHPCLSILEDRFLICCSSWGFLQFSLIRIQRLSTERSVRCTDYEGLWGKFVILVYIKNLTWQASPEAVHFNCHRARLMAAMNRTMWCTTQLLMLWLNLIVSGQETNVFFFFLFLCFKQKPQIWQWLSTSITLMVLLWGDDSLNAVYVIILKKTTN